MPVGRATGVELSWLIVSHDSSPDLRRLLPGLNEALAVLSARGLSSEIIVADNASVDGSAAVAAAEAPGALVLTLPKNLGYGAACNRAAALATGRWLVCSNADLQVSGADFAALPEVLVATTPETGLIGPALSDGRGQFLPSAGHFPTLRRLLLRLPLPAPERPYLAPADHRAGCVDWVTGACLLVRADVFRLLHGFDESYFLYYEDVDLAARARQLGFTTHYAPSLRVSHLHPHASRPRSPLRAPGAGPAPAPTVEEHVRAGRARWFQRYRPAHEQGLLALLARVEQRLRGADGRGVGA